MITHAAPMDWTETDLARNQPPPSSGGQLVSVDGRVLPLRGASVEAEAAGGLARVRLTQRFENPHAEPLEVSYLLPLPADGAVAGFCFSIGETRVVGEIDERLRARERFEEAIAGGQTAALLEQERSSLFSQRLGNIPPGETIVAEIEIDQKLCWLDARPASSGGWEWRFPTVVGPRYMGEPGRVADASALVVDVAACSAGTAKGAMPSVTFALTIDEALAAGIGAVSSPSHALRVTEQGDKTVARPRHDAGLRLDRDLVVRWQVSRPTVGVSLSLEGPRKEAPETPRRAAPDERSTHGLLTVVPPDPPSRAGGPYRALAAPLSAMARDLIVLIDTSGSMSGRPIEQASRIAAAMIDTLGPNDRIELIEFSDRPKRWRRAPQEASRQARREAIGWLAALRAGGGTEMHSGILEAMAPLRGGAQRQVVLITDGYIGFEHEIVAAVRDRLPDSCRVHTVGVGDAVNRSLTAAVARAGRGVELVIGLEEDAERAASRLLARTTAPLITELELSGDALLQAAPARLPDLYAGSPALVALRLDPAGGTLELRGRTSSGSYHEVIAVPAARADRGSAAPRRLFARERVEDLELERTPDSENAEMIDEAIKRLGIGYQIATRMTSWIAVSEQQTVDPDAPRRRERMVHELPHGTSIEGLGLRRAAPSGLAMQGLFAASPAPLSGTRELKGLLTDVQPPEPLGERRKLSAPLGDGPRWLRIVKLLLVVGLLALAAALLIRLLTGCSVPAGAAAGAAFTPLGLDSGALRALTGRRSDRDASQ